MKTYTWRLTVRTYELDRFGHVRDVFLLRYLEETATQASAAVGYPLDWYLANHRLWLIRSWHIRHLAPALYEDELELTTWVADARRVQSNRDYRIRRVGDGQLIAAARSNWAYVDTRQMRPTRLPDDFDEAFAPHQEPLADLRIQPRRVTTIADAHVYETGFTVSSGEIDIVGHVNNSVYPGWTSDALSAAFNRVGWPVERQLAEYGAVFRITGREMEYLQAALEADAIRITSKITGRTGARLCWLHEIYRDDRLLLRDYSSGAFVTRDGVPIRMPEEIARVLIRGQ